MSNINKVIPTSIKLTEEVKEKYNWLKSNTEFNLSSQVRKMIRRRYNIEYRKSLLPQLTEEEQVLYNRVISKAEKTM